jgi:GDPmannose 4,6-dehydratase
VSALLGDASKARNKLGWKPKASFKELVAEMVAADLKNAERDKILRASGHRVYSRQE